MRKIIILVITTITIFYGCSTSSVYEFTQRDNDFDLGWKFMLDSNLEAQTADYDDSKWRTVDLPHDWSIEALPNQNDSTIVGPFNKNSIGGTSTGFVVGGTGWYRKTFVLAMADTAKEFIINFDGVYMESDVWVNGEHVGYHAYGYTPFYYNISKYVIDGKKNTIAVRVKNNGKNSRWYSGSGIYRHVTLSVVSKTHIIPFGTYIITPKVSNEKALVVSSVALSACSPANKLKLKVSIFSGENTTPILVKESDVYQNKITDTLNIEKPNLWSIENPNLYTANYELVENGVIVDSLKQKFGIRSIEFTAEKGFLLNGKSIELKGSCMHHDNGLLGSATYDRAEERRVETMKANGFNAIRTSHNPPSHQFLDACDRLGMLVIDEAFDMWERPKNPQDYANYFKVFWKTDLETFILRDRNHPSVIIWSIGNEINERADTSGERIAKQLRECILAIDSTRPITAAICSFWDHPGLVWKDVQVAFKNLDIGGYNYQWKEYQADHKTYPKRIMMGTESVPKEAYENWQMVEKCPWVIGDFVWTGMDYLGETGIGNVQYGIKEISYQLQLFPWFNAWCGDIDICGNKKPQMIYRDILWRNSSIEIAVHKPIPNNVKEQISSWGWSDETQSWNWSGNEGKKLKVNVYSRCPRVKLLLNGKELGNKLISDTSKLTATFEVTYENGELKAIGLNDKGEKVCEKMLVTSGKATKIKLIAERELVKANRNDLAYIKVETTDDKGNLVPDASNLVEVSVEGNGEWLASGNAAPNDMKSFRNKSFKMLNGKGLIIVRPFARKGEIKIKAISEGMQNGECLIKVE